MHPSDLAVRPLPELLEEAWAVRLAHRPAELAVSAPGPTRYEVGEYKNRALSFVNVSVTDTACSLHCEHCNTQVLAGMEGVAKPGALLQVGEKVRREGGIGLLISGGCDPSGRVPWQSHAGEIAAVHEQGLKVLMHSGLVSREEARELARSGVDQVLLDILGAEETIGDVYHLGRSPRDYRDSLLYLKEAGVAVAPHIVIGLHFGEVRGEWEALEMVREVGVDHLVLVVLKPTPGTAMAHRTPPSPEEAATVAAVARILLPNIPISLGCARPSGREKARLEQYFVDAGVDAVAYPLPETLAHARERGLRVTFSEACCSMVG